MNASGPARLRGVRAAVWTTSVLLLAAAAHALAGGALPSFGVLLATAVPVACAATVLARRTRGLPLLLVTLGLAQVVLHETFMTASSATCAPVHTGAGHHAVSAACDGMPSMAAVHATPSALMIALHVVATVATALLLAHGERLATRVAVWMREVFATAVVVPVARVATIVAVVPTTTPVVRLLAATDVSRRGPPASAGIRPAFA